MRARLLTTADLIWYVLRARPQHEIRVAEQLKRRGWQTFVPVERRYRKKTRYCKSKVPIPYPLMPGYVLLGAPHRQVPWLRIFEHSDATSVIGYQGVPREIAPDAIDQLLRLAKMAHWDRPEWERHMPTHREFGIGDQVQHRSFPGQEIPVEDIRDDELQITVYLFGQPNRMWVPIAQVAAAE